MTSRSGSICLAVLYRHFGRGIRRYSAVSFTVSRLGAFRNLERALPRCPLLLLLDCPADRAICDGYQWSSHASSSGMRLPLGWQTRSRQQQNRAHPEKVFRSRMNQQRPGDARRGFADACALFALPRIQVDWAFQKLDPPRRSARISVTLVSKEAIAPPSYEIKVTQQARKPRKSIIRRLHACIIFSFTHVIGWRVLRAQTITCN